MTQSSLWYPVGGPYDGHHDLTRSGTWYKTSGAHHAPAGRRPAEENQEGLRP
jgi:hypothetical protein